MEDELKELPLSTLITQAVQQCVQAQYNAQDSMLEYIEQSMFSTKDGKRSVAMFSFSFVENGERVFVRMPLAMVVPAQFLQIQDIEIDFNVDIRSTGKLDYKVAYAPSRKAIKSAKSTTYDLRNNIAVNIKASNLGMSGGMARLLEIAGTHATTLRPSDQNK